MKDVDDLKGVSVLLTRPRGRGESLCRAIAARGGAFEPLPLVDIEPARVDGPLAEVIDDIALADIVIFVSVNAVEHGLALMRQRDARFAPGVSVAAVGRASAEALARHGVGGAVYPPGRSNSEELLECEILKRPAGRRVVIFRGQDGRELIADTLVARGADVRYASVYRREPARIDATPIVTRWLEAPRPVLVLTSEGTARLLLARLPASVGEALQRMPVVVLSDRLARYCRDDGWRGPIVTSQSTRDEDLLACVARVSTTSNQLDTDE